MKSYGWLRPPPSNVASRARSPPFVAHLLHLDSMHVTSRGAVLASFAALASQPLLLRPRAWAAIPSISEYDSVQYKKKQVIEAAPSTASLAPADGLRAVRAALTVLEPMVASGDFEGARNLLRQPLFASFLGYTPGVRGNVGSLKPAAALAQASTSTAALAELLLDLKRIDEFCLSNRVIVFNVEDLEQVNRLMAAPTQKPEDRFDLDEVRSFIADAREHIGEALAALR